MPLHRVLPFYVLLLAACSAPPETAHEAAAINTGPNCQGTCAAGYRWAVENTLTSPAKCRGEGEFGRGCREAVAFAKSF